MSNSQNWVKQNCKFAVYEEHRKAPHLVSQPPAPQSEDELMEDFDQSYMQRNAIFSRLGEDLKNLQAALDMVGNPNYPTFTEAFQQAFGNSDPTQVKETLDRLQTYFKVLENHPKFAG